MESGRKIPTPSRYNEGFTSVTEYSYDYSNIELAECVLSVLHLVKKESIITLVSSVTRFSSSRISIISNHSSTNLAPMPIIDGKFITK